MSRETVEAKARRLRDSDRVTIWCDEGRIRARAEGDHGDYELSLWPAGRFCPCAARIRTCAHVRAVEAVTSWRRR